jgi:hypothetical protein
MPPFGWRKKTIESEKISSHRGAAFDDVEIRGTSRAEFSSNKRYQKRKSKQPTVEDADTASDREYESILVLKAPNGERKLRVAMRLLEAAANTLAEIGDAEEIEALFQATGVDGENTVQEMRKKCFRILGLLPEARSINADETPSTIDLYDQSFLYRASSSLIYLLKPVDVFKGNKFYNRGKVFGYIRAKGSTAVLMTALPGWVESVDPHPKLLDSELWTEIVKHLADFHNHRFATGLYDARHKKEKGYGYASHVEPRLMVWFAIDLLQKRTGKVGSPLEQRGNIWKLKDEVQETIEAEIVLSRPPCPQCRAFQQFFEGYTHIKFSFIVMKNLGEAREVKNKQNYKSFSLFAYQYSDSESEADQAVEEDDEYAYISRQAIPHAERQKKRFQIVIPSRPATQGKEIQYTANTDAEAESEEEIEVQTRVRVSKAHRQIDFGQYYHTPSKSREISKKRMRTYGNSSDEEEYEPPSSKSRRRNVGENVMTPKKKNLPRNGPLTPPQSAEFGRDAQEYARKINKKRMR